MLLLAVALMTAAATTLPATTPTTECPKTTPHVAVERGKAPPFRELNELPSGNMYSAVYRQVNGCEKPIVVRYDVGRR